MSFEADRCVLHPYRKDIYVSRVFSLLDYACQVRHIGLTVLDSDKLEGIQKRAITIAFPELYYECAVNRANINTIRYHPIPYHPSHISGTKLKSQHLEQEITDNWFSINTNLS